MGKKLILLSALGLAGTASAQSSVTLFGVIDATVAIGHGSVADRTQMLRGGYNASRIGFRGTEDLGGGLNAGFWLESGINNDDGSGAAPANTNNQVTGTVPGGGLTFGRRSFVSLGAAWGEFRAGRDFASVYWGYLGGDPFLNNGVGAAVNFQAAIAGPVLVCVSNMAGFWSSDFAGFKLEAMHYRGENLSNVPNSRDGGGSTVRLTYANGPLSAAAGYGRTDYLTGDLIQRTIDAQWNFGFMRLMADINRDSLGGLNARGGAVGVSVPFGPGEFKAAYSQHETNAVGQPRAKKVAIGYVHNLSKRTALYATYARVHNSAGSAVSLNGGITAPNAPSSGVDLGIRHSF